jgi:hypothetical protein
MFRRRHHSQTVRPLTRSRWAAVGAAVAVTVGGGGLVGVSAAGGDTTGSLFTAISPVRMLDTRSQSMVGALDGSGAPLRLQVTGDRVPAGAESVSMNVTVVDGRATAVGGFVTVYPCDIGRPDTSNLNFVNGQTVPNAVTVPLAADGSVCFHVYGRAHLLADVMGFHGDARIAAIEAELGRLRAASTAEPAPTTPDLGAYATRTETSTMIDSAISAITTDVDLSDYADRSETGSMIDTAIAAIETDLSGYADRSETDAMIGTAVETAVDELMGVMRAEMASLGTGPAPLHGRVIDAVGAVWHGTAAWTDGGHQAAVTIGVDGLPLIAHHDVGSSALLLTRCADTLCTTANTARINSIGGGTDGLDLAIGLDGLPVLAFASGGPASTLTTVKCTDPTCATLTARSHPIGTVSGHDPALTIGVDGLPLIAHIADGDLVLTRCHERSCTTVTHLTVPGTGPTAADPTITVRPDGIPEIAVSTADGLRLVTCADTSCSTVAGDRVLASTGPGTTAIGLTPSLAVDTAGLLRIAHRATDTEGLSHLMLTTCADVACSTSLTEPVDGSAHSGGHSPTMLIAVDGTPTITHIHRWADGTSRLRVTTIGDGSSTSADTHITAHGAVSTIDADGAIVTALRVDNGAASTLAFHRRVQRSWTANGWGD